MSNVAIRRIALAFLAVAAMTSTALGLHGHSVPWFIVGGWLTGALAVETWPRRES